jgi:hypothetical protein
MQDPGGGRTPNVITYSAAISACEKEQQPERMLQLTDGMQDPGGGRTPNVITYSTAKCDLQGDESIAMWGDAVNDGDSSAVQAQLQDGVRQILYNEVALAASKNKALANMKGDWLTINARCNGSTATCGHNDGDQCNSSVLKDGVTYAQVAVGCIHTVSLRSDGRAAKCGHNDEGKCTLSLAEDCLAWLNAQVLGLGRDSQTSEISEVEMMSSLNSSVFQPGLKTFSSISDDNDGRLVEGSGICGGGPCFVWWGVGGGVGSVSGACGRGTKFGGGVSCDALGFPVLTRTRRDDDVSVDGIKMNK